MGATVGRDDFLTKPSAPAMGSVYASDGHGRILLLKLQKRTTKQSQTIHQRLHGRVPYFGPLGLALKSGGVRSVFSLDVSRGGLGFCHKQPIEGRFSVCLPSVLGRSVTRNAEVVWTREYGTGWLISGARFSEALSYEWAELRVASSAASLKRRSSAREPFISPIDVRYLSKFGVEKALSRDISATGIGLIQPEPPQADEVIIAYTRFGVNYDVRATLAWFKQIDDEFFLSGWRFVPKRLMLEELC